MEPREGPPENIDQELSRLRERVALLEAAVARHRKTEREFARVLDAAPVLACTAGLDGYYKYVNPAFERILGYTEQESLARPFIDFIHPDDRAAAQAEMSRLAAGEPVVIFEDRNICKDGSHRWLSWTVVPMPESGLVYGVGRDITEQKLAEEGLRKAHRDLELRVEERTAELNEINKQLGREVESRTQSEEVLRQVHDELRIVHESMADGLVVVDRETKRILCTNAAMCKMLGYSEDELLTLSLTDMHPRDKLAVIVQKFDSDGHRPSASVDNIPVLRKDGTVFYADITSNPLTYRSRPCTIGFFRDATDRRRAFEILQRSEEVTKALVNAPLESAILIEKDGTIVTLNDTAAARLGGRVNELVGQCIFDLFPPDVAERRRQMREEVVRTKQAVRTEDARGGRYFDSRVYPVFGVSGEVTQLAIYSHDVTDRKRLERELVNATDREHERIGRELHDGIAQQLTGLSLFAQSLHGELKLHGRPESETAGAIANGIRDTVATVGAIVKGAMPLGLSELDFTGALHALAVQIEQRFGTSCKFVGGQEVPIDDLARRQLFFIAQEAATNAAKHARPRQITIKLEATKASVVLTVRDDGLGIQENAELSGGAGLRIMRYRADLIGSRLDIQRSGDGGTVVRCTVKKT